MGRARIGPARSSVRAGGTSFARVWVKEIRRYPVKSMGGETLESCEVSEVGIAFDRAWGVVDNATGLVLTGRREPRLLQASARVEDERLIVVLPGGGETDKSQDVAAWLDRDVTLRRAGGEGGVYECPLDFENDEDWESWQGPGGAWHDSTKARLSLVSTATIADWDARRFRPNLLLEGSGEDSTVGHIIQIGEVELDVQKPLTRCVMVTRQQPGVARDLDVLKTINRDRNSCLAVGALVRKVGTLAVGDELVDLGAMA
jgi:uncharacterized protein YcbX